MAAADAIHVVCPHCDALNRLPEDKTGAGARCGKCHRPLFEGHPVPLDETRFESHIVRNDIPVLVDFWAEWCGPCKMMAPVFQQAATELEPRVRLAKVDTDRAQAVALQYGIRSIPTLILFKDGREIARTAGAMNLSGLLAWVRRYL
jgi:thioredoxin 2